MRLGAALALCAELLTDPQSTTLGYFAFSLAGADFHVPLLAGSQDVTDLDPSLTHLRGRGDAARENQVVQPVLLPSLEPLYPQHCSSQALALKSDGNAFQRQPSAFSATVSVQKC